MTSELAKWFDAITTTCLNVNPRLLDGVNVGLAKSELLSSATITERLQVTETVRPDARPDKPLRRPSPRRLAKTEGQKPDSYTYDVNDEPLPGVSR